MIRQKETDRGAEYCRGVFRDEAQNILEIQRQTLEEG